MPFDIDNTNKFPIRIPDATDLTDGLMTAADKAALDACARHRDRSIKTYDACMYCNGPRPSVDIDGVYAHKKCHKENCR